MCSKSTTKISERGHCRRSSIFALNFERISHVVLVFPLLTLIKLMPAGLIAVVFCIIVESNYLGINSSNLGLSLQK